MRPKRPIARLAPRVGCGRPRPRARRRRCVPRGPRRRQGRSAQPRSGPSRPYGRQPLLAATVKATGEGSRALADVIEATPELSTLIALLLGPDMDALIVPAADVDALAADVAAESASGTVLLVPSDARALSVPAGVAARRLVDEISYPADAAAAVESLLGNVVVCDTPAEARALAAGNPGVCAVTAQGAIARTTGALEVVRPSSDAVDAIAEHRKLEEARVRATRAERCLRRSGRSRSPKPKPPFATPRRKAFDACRRSPRKKGDANAARSRPEQSSRRALPSSASSARSNPAPGRPQGPREGRARRRRARRARKRLSDTVEGAKADIDDLREAPFPCAQGRRRQNARWPEASSRPPRPRSAPTTRPACSSRASRTCAILARFPRQGQT